MARVKVFIASSSEGLDVVKAVRLLLLQELRDGVEIEPWTRAFELSATYIESLEKAVVEADFAVLVLTPDDLTTIRHKQKFTSRDNVIFELGLFMGSLGRGRCFLVQDDRPNLRIPSDLLGVKAATYRKPAEGDLKAALDPVCAMIGERIAKKGARHKLSPEVIASMAATRDFCGRAEGVWWDRLLAGGSHKIGFFQIEYDEALNSMRMLGRSFSGDGTCVARWNSMVARILKEERKLLYYWEGWHPQMPNERFQGVGEMQFEASAGPDAPFVRGGSKFSDIDAAHPERSVVKSTEFRRVEDEKDVAVMNGGKEKEIRALVVKRLSEW
jgi:hypothetical protein